VPLQNQKSPPFDLAGRGSNQQARLSQISSRSSDY